MYELIYRNLETGALIALPTMKKSGGCSLKNRKI